MRAERNKTDEELARRRDKNEEDADQVVRLARQRADVVLRTGRERADQRTGSADHERVASERAQEDAIVAEERRLADETLTLERKQQQLALIALLAKEREATDLRLLLERIGADHALAARDEFLALVSHDLRAFLGTIALNAHLLRRLAEKDAAPENVSKPVQTIEKVTAQMARLVGDLVDVASIEAGKLTLFPQRHDVGVLLRDAVEAVRPAAAAARIEVAAEVPEGGLVASVDADRMLQVLANLIGNALKFTPAGGRVTVRGERVGEVVQVAVSDTGEGIPADRLDTIFDRFAQGRQRDRGGLGLGLYIAKRIIGAHHGELRVESQPGRGSTFYFRVPAGET